MAFIRDAQVAGFSLRQIGQILEIRDSGEAPCAHVGQLIDQRLHQVEQRIVELQETLRNLHELALRKSKLDPADCHGYCHIIDTGRAWADLTRHERGVAPGAAAVSDE